MVTFLEDEILSWCNWCIIFICSSTRTTSFPGSLFVHLTSRYGKGKKRDHGNEIMKNDTSVDSFQEVSDFFPFPASLHFFFYP